MRIRQLRNALLVGWCALALPLIGACSDAGQGAQQEDTGSLSLALLASANGHVYRLRSATFVVSGPGSALLDSEVNPDAQSLTAVLPPGTYSVHLLDGWFFERLDDSGPVRVDATLVSDNPATVQLAPIVTTTLPFRFETAGVPVTFDPGTLAIIAEITETNGGPHP